MVEKPNLKNDDNNSIQTFKDFGLRGFFSFIILIPWTAIIVTDFVDTSLSGQLFFILTFFFFFGINIWLLHFFALSEEYFVVKNHVFFWKEDVYHYKDIKVIIFESNLSSKLGSPNCLRIKTKDLRDKLYPASSLWDSTWLELKEELEKKKVRVKNENHFLS